MKKWLLFVFAAWMVTGFSAAALAAVEGTHHDLRTYNGTGDTCYPCHGFKETAAGNVLLKNVGSMCYTRCHIGATGMATNFPLATSYAEIGYYDNVNNQIRIGVSSPQPTPGYTGNTITKYTTGHGMGTAPPAPDTQAMVTATNWPYTAAAGDLQCTSCHDVHSNANTPFLRAPLSDNTTRANAFCHRCHGAVADGAARYVDEYTAAANGSHPSEVGYGMAVTTLFSGGLNRLGRTIEFKDLTPAGANPAVVFDNAVFRNWSYNGAQLNSNANHYNPGGKLGDFAGTGNVGCYTCHAVHLSSSDSGQNYQLVVPYRAAGTRSQSDLCVGCHGSRASSARNPGVTAYWHPVDTETRSGNIATPSAATYQVTTGTFYITVNMSQGAGLGNVYDNGINLSLTCLSCHGGGLTAGNHQGVHNGPATTSVLSPTKPTCASCHNTVAVQGLGAGTNQHHVYGGGAAQGTIELGYGYTSPVNYNATQSANLTDGLSCEDCHLFNGTAHNW